MREFWGQAERFLLSSYLKPVAEQDQDPNNFRHVLHVRVGLDCGVCTKGLLKISMTSKIAKNSPLSPSFSFTKEMSKRERANMQKLHLKKTSRLVYYTTVVITNALALSYSG